MRLLRSLIRPALAGFLMAAASLAPAQTNSWQLVWSDEFNGSIGPNWVFETGAGGWGNNELQYYRRENATVENGALVITAKRENFGGASYTSARMKTQGLKTFRFGRIEARMKLPSFLGAWPAFWMLGANLPQVGWPASGEIDVMEHVNDENKVYGTIHWQDHTGKYAQYGGNTATTVVVGRTAETASGWTKCVAAHSAAAATSRGPRRRARPAHRTVASHRNAA